MTKALNQKVLASIHFTLDLDPVYKNMTISFLKTQKMPEDKTAEKKWKCCSSSLNNVAGSKKIWGTFFHLDSSNISWY